MKNFELSDFETLKQLANFSKTEVFENNDAIKKQKILIADYCANLVSKGQSLGLGSGSTAEAFVKALAARKIELGHLIPSSENTYNLAASLNLNITEFEKALINNVEVTFDGADEMVVQKNENGVFKLLLIKGGGGAMARERKVIKRGNRFIVMADARKISQGLGRKFYLPVEVDVNDSKFILDWVAKMKLENFGIVSGGIRQKDGGNYTTDNGNFIVDFSFSKDQGILNLNLLEKHLNSLEFVFEHGLFLTEATEMVVMGEFGVHHYKFV